MQHITHQPIHIAELFAEMHSSGTGAVVMFSGEIRGANKGKEIVCLEYEAYESMAERIIAGILEEARRKWPLNKVICVHRVGRLDISECAVVVITASAHRDAAYKANRFIIDEVKHNAPIWKNEVFSDGSNEWGNNCEGCLQHHHDDELTHQH